MQLDLNDLCPEEATFSLSEKPGKTYTMKKFSLREQIWVRNRFGSPEVVKKIFETQDLGGIAEIAHHLIKDKTDFPEFLDFAECIVKQVDKVAVQKALLTTIGISQPVLDELYKKEEEKKKEEQKEPPSPNELSPPK